MSGHCPQEAAKIFFGGRLLALEKKTGGIRPIAIGFTLRRLSSKVANSVGLTRLGSYFNPRQLGVGVAGGCEAAIHASRRYLQALDKGKVLVKLDFTNAFNCLHRGDLLRAAHSNLPDLYPYIHASYASPSLLFYGTETILSNEGPQQGDPLGPLLFCNSIHPLLDSLKAELTLGYLDDLTLAGVQSVVAEDIQLVQNEGGAMGLHLNISKCELYTHQDTLITDPILASFRRFETSEANLLGAPLFQGPGLDQAWSDRCEDMARASVRLKDLGAQDALILLRASFGAPRVQHLLRCSPSSDHPGLSVFDGLQREALSKVANANLSDVQWDQATLPLKMGGLGLRKVATLATSSFLASTSSTAQLQDTILEKSPRPEDNLLSQVLQTWEAKFGSPPEGALRHKQSSWDHPVLDNIKEHIWANKQSDHEKAIFLAAVTPHSGAWLSALPISACGLRLDDEAVRVAVALRLGLKLCIAHDCRCGQPVDAWGTHALVCKHAAARHTRHFAVNDIIARSISSAGFPIAKEPLGVFRDNLRRPDGITLVPWLDGRAIAWDATITCTLADSYISASASQAGSAAESADARKTSKYSNVPQEFTFQPLAFESLGAVSVSTSCFLSLLGRRISLVSGDLREESYLRQRLSICIQRYNSILLLQSFEEPTVEPD